MSIKNLLKNNPKIELQELKSAKGTIVLKAWNDYTFAFVIPKETSIPALSNICLQEEFS